MIRILIGLLAMAICVFVPTPSCAQNPPRVWVDTDAACGLSAYKDVDDCLALAALANTNAPMVAGVSTSFGNVSRAHVDGVVGGLMPIWRTQYGLAPPVWPGARRAGDCANNEAATALARALEREKLVILALGPLTNIACVLRTRPRLESQIVRLIAVAGVRPGHVFHIAEGARGAMFFGHGPVASDFNVKKDTDAVALILTSDIAITLTPYELARQIEVDATELTALARSGPLGTTVSQTAMPWLKTWQTYAGRDGFYPFDLLAVAAVLRPQALMCQRQNAQVRIDTRITNSRFGPRRLLVGGGSGRGVIWCDRLSPSGQRFVLELLESKQP
jgi:purine nucleosidase